ncbi:hypothetical protein G3H63_09370 [Microbacterium resistens]|uniref:hypothetical protein n=1 Tax=Microbacterium resistens TaxID=156977 RepID=UPI001C599D8C|nr:hypothetical protein [Microbacterium resistens]MBW1639279.1 hypothetical protein [Microbacterium resistens]
MRLIMITVRLPKLPSRSRRMRERRVVALAVAALQQAEGMALHGARDKCLVHTIIAAQMRENFAGYIPARYLSDPDWMHRHVEAPGVRIQARLEDEWAKQ